MKVLFAAASIAALAACTTSPGLLPESGLAPAAGETAEILETVDAFLLAVGNGDAAGMLETQYAGGMDAFVTIKAGVAGPVGRAPTSELQTVGPDFDPFIERYWDPVVHVRGSIAHVWAPYELRDNGAVVHCGVDAFQMVRTPGGWKIHSLMFTMEPDGCDGFVPDSPAAMRPRDGWREARNE